MAAHPVQTAQLRDSSHHDIGAPPRRHDRGHPREETLPSRLLHVRAYSHQAKAKKIKEQVKHIKEQECIPVGCIPPAAVAIRGGLHQGYKHVGIPPAMHAGIAPPHVNRMTNRCKNSFRLPKVAKDCPSLPDLTISTNTTTTTHNEGIILQSNQSNSTEQ